MRRDKIILGGFEQWVEYNERLCSLTIFGFETAKHGVEVDVMGMKGHRHVTNLLFNGGLSGHAKLTEQEQKELNNYINSVQ